MDDPELSVSSPKLSSVSVTVAVLPSKQDRSSEALPPLKPSRVSAIANASLSNELIWSSTFFIDKSLVELDF